MTCAASRSVVSFIVASSRVVRGRARRSRRGRVFCSCGGGRARRAHSHSRRVSGHHGHMAIGDLLPSPLSMSQSWAPNFRVSGKHANLPGPNLDLQYTADTNPLSNWHIHNTSASAADDSRPDVIPLTLAATYVNVREHAKWGNVRLLVRG